MVNEVIEFLANRKGIDRKEVEKIVERNFRKGFGLN